MAWKKLSVKERKFVLRTAEKEDIRRVSVILDTTIPDQNKVNAINIFLEPVLAFFMPVLFFSHEDLSEVDLKIKRLLTEREVTYPQHLSTLFYASRSVGGCGFKEVTNIDLQRNQEQVSFKTASKDPKLEAVVQFQEDKEVED